MLSMPLKTYQIPFAPEYILCATLRDKGVWLREDLIPLNEAKGELNSFRFHLSKEAIALIQKDDPEVTENTGFCKLTIKFDTAESGPAILEVSRGCFK